MKIEIKDDLDLLTLSDESLDNNNFVEITIENEEKEIATMIVSIDELEAAVISFIKLRKSQLERDKMYE